MGRDTKQTEFGDYQTPADLAADVLRVIAARFPTPATAIEPTCGRGNFLLAANATFGASTRLLGVETNAEHLAHARRALRAAGRSDATLIHADVFDIDFAERVATFPGPYLIVGNPPWVTNARLGTLGSDNLPRKSNAQKLRGLDAMTGKSNFDISEWICVRLLESFAGLDACFALLIKTAVARKLLTHAWTHALPLAEPAIYSIDAKRHFGAAVDACLFVGRTRAHGEQRCPTHATLHDANQTGALGLLGSTLVPDIEGCRSTAALTADADDEPEWRSGIKHDCAKLLELVRVDGVLVNGLGQRVEVERGYLFPLMKSSDVANDAGGHERWLIVPQRETSQATADLQSRAPKLWRYLCEHEAALDGRKSSIYRGRPRFAIFGVGPYSFAPWKVAISGLYKQLRFRLVGPAHELPVVFDDTVYFTPCADEAQARRTLARLESEPATRFLNSRIFWDAKRPITASLLRQLSLAKLEPADG